MCCEFDNAPAQVHLLGFFHPSSSRNVSDGDFGAALASEAKCKQSRFRYRPPAATFNRSTSSSGLFVASTDRCCKLQQVVKDGFTEVGLSRIGSSPRSRSNEF